MKQIITLLSLLFITLCVYGQRKEPIQDIQLKSSQSSKQKVDSVIIQMWDENSSTWIIFSKQDFKYDTRGNMTQCIVDDWKDEYIYDASNNFTKSLEYKWNETSKQWEKKGEKEYTYDASGNMILCLETDHKEEYMYDASGNMTEQLEYYQDAPDHWVKQYKHNYSYNTNGDRSQTIGYRWDEGSGQWVAIDKLDYTFDASDYIIQSLYFSWDESTGKWEDCWKEEYTVDDEGNIIQNLQSEWGESGVAETLAKFEYTYDNSYALSDLVLPIFDDDFSISEALDIIQLFNHKLVSFVVSAWDDIKNDWNDLGKGEYYYSAININYLNKTETEIVRIYPNPSEDIINIEIENLNNTFVEIYAVNSKKVFSKKLHSNNETIDLSSFEKGVYLIRISNENFTLTKKVVKVQ